MLSEVSPRESNQLSFYDQKLLSSRTSRVSLLSPFARGFWSHRIGFGRTQRKKAEESRVGCVDSRHRVVASIELIRLCQHTSTC